MTAVLASKSILPFFGGDDLFAFIGIRKGFYEL
jgi:hypothetical protein